MITIILAEDYAVFREGLKAFLQRQGMAVVGEAGDGAAALQLATSLQPDIAVLDISMPILNGIGAAAEMRTVAPKTKTIMLTMQREYGFVSRAARAGAAGYILKTKATTELIDAIHEVLSGKLYVGNGISRSAFETGGLVNSVESTADSLRFSECVRPELARGRWLAN